jgi:hypothetical protein
VSRAHTCLVIQQLTVPGRDSTRVAATGALFSAVNPTLLSEPDLSRTMHHAIEIAASMGPRSLDVRRSLFGGVTKLFDRVRESGKGGRVDFDASALKALLFGPNVDIEALRVLRADAIDAIAKSSALVMSKVRDEVSGIRREEVSPAVRERLDAALKRGG